MKTVLIMVANKFKACLNFGRKFYNASFMPVISVFTGYTDTKRTTGQ